jgi:predicted dehydrogenase
MNRRKFLDTMALGAAGLAVSSTAKSYSQIVGSNDRLNFAILGLRWRGYAHLAGLQANSDKARVSHICDVDSRILAKFSAAAQKALGYEPANEKDFRNILARRDVDVITLAVPDHWHAPLAISALEAGKHVYVEKPCCHNPAEGAMLVAAARKYQKHVQQGNQMRSSQPVIEAMDKIHNGLIGDPYFAKAWYSNTRKDMGFGKVVPVPPELDWDLWQGPAPRRPYKDNIHPYNWHWLRHWGTGESGNNGIHVVDICRWALGVDFPITVAASGRRYAFKDDQQFYDTIAANFQYGDKTITWEGQSCNGLSYFDQGTGLAVVGTTGSVVMGIEGKGYQAFDREGKSTGVFGPDSSVPFYNKMDGDIATDAHFANLIAAIRTGEKLHAPIADGNKSTSTMLLSNIAWTVNRQIQTDPQTGEIHDDPEAMKLWSREYEPGWEPHV